jgi:ATP-binding cassette subfamily C protein
MSETGDSSKAAHETKRDFLSLLKIAGISWSLLTAKEKSYFLIRVAFRLALNGIDVVAVALMGLLGAITANGLSGQSLTIFGYQIPSPTATNVTVLVSVVAFLFVVKGGLAIIFGRWTYVFLSRVEIKNSAKIARYLFGGSLQRLKRYSRPEIGFLVDYSTNATFSGVLGSLTTLVIESSLFLAIFVMFLIVDWSTALVIGLYFALLVFVLQATTSQKFVASGGKMRDSRLQAGGSILEMVDGFREIAVLSKQDFFLTRLIEAKKLAARTGVLLQTLKGLPRYIAETGLIFGALGFTVWQLSQGTLAEGLFALGVFLAGSFRMMGAILPLQAVWNELRVMQKWVVMAQEILVQLRDTPELLDVDIFSDTGRLPARAAAYSELGGLSVELKNVVFYHSGTASPTIKKVSLNIASGAYVAIVGPSGAGKTTLVDLLLGLYDPARGSVRVGGEDPRALREHSPGLLSYVPQRPGLVSGSLANNVALGVPDDEIDEYAVRESLRKAQLMDFVDTLPEGIHSSLGPHADSLSGGQIQRLGFARALYTKPQLIILDEATSALDAATEASVASSIKNVGGETTVIVIAHRLSTIQDADQVHVMDAGKIIASGTFSEIRKAVPMVEEYVQLMSFRNE